MPNPNWPAALLADDSNDALLIFADWLEDQGDPACEGVRALLVGMGKRPLRLSPTGRAVWVDDHGSMQSAKLKNRLPTSVCKYLTGKPILRKSAFIYEGSPTVDTTHLAAAVYRALIDAARAYTHAKEHAHAP